MAADHSGRPGYLLEKDIWVVYTLQALWESPFADQLIFKGGTSLSKAYGAIRRFSEDIDITYDIRAIAPDLIEEKGDAEALPATSSQAKKWRKKITRRLQTWIAEELVPAIRGNLERVDGFTTLRSEGERAYIGYHPSLEGAEFVKPLVLIDFGALSTGEPRERRRILCDAASLIPEIEFPACRPIVMRPERTFWEKATAIHVFCQNGGAGGERLSRHWHDLVRLDESDIGARALADRSVARRVARLKNTFYRERGSDGEWIDFEAVVSGSLQLVPGEARREGIAEDYDKMVEAGMLYEDAEPFDSLMTKCAGIERRANGP